MKLTTLHVSSYPTAPSLEFVILIRSDPELFQRVRPKTGSDHIDIIISKVYKMLYRYSKVVELVVVLLFHKYAHLYSNFYVLLDLVIGPDPELSEK
jgi:hypothetical protein